MKVQANRPTYVEVDGSQTLLEVGQEADVDGRTYSAEHISIKFGDLSVVEDKPKRGKTKAEPKQEDKPASDDTQEG